MRKPKNVNSLKGLKPNVVYTTTNYSLFKHSEYNRASVKGFIDKKLNEFKSIMKSGNFYEHLQEIKVNMLGVAWEGNHRLELLKDAEMPIRFLMYDVPEVNGTAEEMARVQIAFNGVRSNWERTQIFNTALNLGLPLAEALEVKYTSLLNDGTYKFLNKKNITPSKILGILMKDSSMLHGRKITLDILSNESLVKKLNEPEFIDELNFTLKTMELLYSKRDKLSNEPREIIKRVLKSVWNKTVTKEKIFHMISKKGFSCDSGAKSINNLLSLYVNFSLSSRVKLITW